MSNRRRYALLATVFAMFGAGAASAETLADAITLAYETNPTLQAQRAQQRALDETYVQARSGFRPQLNASVQAVDSRTDTPRAAGVGDIDGDGIPDTSRDTRTGSAALTLSQPIWTGGRVAAAVSAAEADILAGRENLRRIEAQVLAQVVQTYVDVRRDQDALRIRQENVSVLQRQLEESNARFEVGEITRTDVAQSEARLAAARAQFAQAQAQLGISRATYAAVVGQNPGELAPPPPLTLLLPASVDQAFDVATANNPQIRAAELTAQASKARIAGARAERMPQVALTGRLGFSGEVDPLDTEEWSRNVQAGATVTVPLFSGGLVSSRVRQARERSRVDEINIEANRRAVLQTISQTWNQLTASRANIGSTSEQVRAARIAAEGTRQEQQVGLRTTIDVLNAEQELRNAELSQINAQRDEYVAASLVLSAMGRLEAKNLIPNTPRYDPASNFRSLRITWGWVPWEEPIAIVDQAVTIAPAPRPAARPVEGPISTAPAAAGSGN